MDNSNEPLGWRSLGLLAVGTLAGAMLTRFVGPVAAQGLGALRSGRGNSDVFDDLTADHKLVLGVLDEMITSTGAQRARLFLKLKRNLSKHALAEEDVIYPLLRERTGAREDVDRLFHEHAEMKIALAQLEEQLEARTDWTSVVRPLRDLIARHAADEETVEFPRLRAALDEKQRADASGKVYREKALLS